MTFKSKIVHVTELLDDENKVLPEFMPDSVITQITNLQESLDALNTSLSESENNFSAQNLNYTYIQQIPSSYWTVIHNLGKIPSITIIDTAGTQVWADIINVTPNSFDVVLQYPMSGMAVCN
jgi:uncharacterized alpha-E superfamily protein